MRKLLATFILMCWSALLHAQSNGQPIKFSKSNPFNTKLNQPVSYAQVNGNDLKEYIGATLQHVTESVAYIKNQKKPIKPVVNERELFKKSYFFLSIT